MHVVIVTEQDGKIVLAKDELQKMLDDAFAKGYEEGKIAGQTHYTWPIITPTGTVYYKDNITCCSSAATGYDISLSNVSDHLAGHD